MNNSEKVLANTNKMEKWVNVLTIVFIFVIIGMVVGGLGLLYSFPGGGPRTAEQGHINTFFVNMLIFGFISMCLLLIIIIAIAVYRRRTVLALVKANVLLEYKRMGKLWMVIPYLTLLWPLIVFILFLLIGSSTSFKSPF